MGRHMLCPGDISYALKHREILLLYCKSRNDGFEQTFVVDPVTLVTILCCKCLLMYSHLGMCLFSEITQSIDQLKQMYNNI